MLNFSKLAILGLIFTGTVAQAHARWSTLDMSCREARETVKSYGAIVLSTGPDLYDRYVNTFAYCDRAKDEMVPAWVPTADSNQCFIGWTCEWRHNE